MKTSNDIIEEAIREGRAVARLADGDVHICDLSQHMFPDVICTEPDCGTAYDSQLRHEPHLKRWRNGDTARAVTVRDNWRNGRCPLHC